MGWTYNTVDPNAPTTGPTITGVGIALTTLSLTTVILRLYVRARLIKALGIGTLLLSCPAIVCGYHLWACG